MCQHRRREIDSPGFTLIELLIVIVVILLLASIALPNFLKARSTANEASAVASLRAIGSGQIAYRVTEGRFTTLTGLTQAKVIDEALGTGIKSGYRFSTAPGTIADHEFTITAEPTVPSGFAATGRRFFFANEDHVLRFNIGSAADAGSRPLDN